MEGVLAKPDRQAAGLQDDVQVGKQADLSGADAAHEMLRAELLGMGRAGGGEPPAIAAAGDEPAIRLP